MIMKIKCLILTAVLISCCCMSLLSCSLSAYDQPEILNVEYKSGLFLNIYRPITRISSKDPVVIYFHGGGWVSGSKDEAGDTFHTLMQSLREGGVTVITADYSLMDDTNSTSYKNCVSDTIDCVDWLIENAGLYNIDTSNICVMGYSAGAYLALMSSYAADADEGIFNGAYDNISDKKIKLCVSIAAPVLFTNEHSLGYSTDALYSYARYLFDDTSEAYYDDLYSSSVINNMDVTDETTVLRIYTFGNDNVVPDIHASDLYNTALASDLDVRYISFAGFDHYMLSYKGDPDIKQAVYTKEEMLLKISADVIEILK